MPKDPSPSKLGPIAPDVLYPLPELQARSGLGTDAMRTARRQGLLVHYTAGRAFVLGSDFIRYVVEHSTTTRTSTAA